MPLSASLGYVISLSAELYYHVMSLTLLLVYPVSISPISDQ